MRSRAKGSQPSPCLRAAKHGVYPLPTARLFPFGGCMSGFLRVFGCFWYGLVLVSLIWSTSTETMREHITGTTLLPYLLVWFAALLPGIIVFWIAEKDNLGRQSH